MTILSGGVLIKLASILSSRLEPMWLCFTVLFQISFYHLYREVFHLSELLSCTQNKTKNQDVLIQFSLYLKAPLNV